MHLAEEFLKHNEFEEAIRLYQTIIDPVLTPFASLPTPYTKYQKVVHQAATSMILFKKHKPLEALSNLRKAKEYCSSDDINFLFRYVERNINDK